MTEANPTGEYCLAFIWISVCAALSLVLAAILGDPFLAHRVN